MHSDLLSDELYLMRLNRTRFLGQFPDLNHHAAFSSIAFAYASRGVLCPWRSMSHSWL